MIPTVGSLAQNHIIEFYDPVVLGRDARGRTQNSILAWDNGKLESCHDYIQVLFPLPEGSPFNWMAPIVNRVTFDAFRFREELRERLRASFVRILNLYDLQLQSAGADLIVVSADNFSRASGNWVTRFNHNHLRITRIIRSLRVLGLEEEARAFFVILKQTYYGTRGKICSRSFMYWSRAAKRPLFIAPDDDEDPGEGIDFLHEYEMARRGGDGQQNSDALEGRFPDEA